MGFANSLDEEPAASESGALFCQVSTDAFPKGDEAEGWTSIAQLGGYNMRIETPRRQLLHANGEGRGVPGVSVFSATTSPHLAQWGDGWMASDDIAVYFNRGAGLAFKQNGRDELITDAGAVVIDLTSAAAVACFGGPFTILRAPRRILGELANDQRLFARKLRNDTAAMRLLESYLGVLKNRESVASPRQQEMVANHLHDLLALAIGVVGDEAQMARARGGAAARLYALKADIDRHLFEHRLGAEFLARASGVTRRHVHRLFEAEGVTLSKYIFERRMLEAYRLLTRPEANGRTIVDIAFSVGFNDLSYFNRGFARRFAATPQEVRNVFGTSRKRR